MEVKPELTISPRVVSSSGFCDKAIECIVDWHEHNYPDDVDMPVLRQWRAGEIGTHLPVIWGSGWACDVPIYLNYLVECRRYTYPELYDVVCALRDYEGRGHWLLWHIVQYIADLYRDGLSYDDIHTKCRWL